MKPAKTTFLPDLDSPMQFPVAFSMKRQQAPVLESRRDFWTPFGNTAVSTAAVAAKGSSYDYPAFLDGFAGAGSIKAKIPQAPSKIFEKEKNEPFLMATALMSSPALFRKEDTEMGQLQQHQNKQQMDPSFDSYVSFLVDDSFDSSFNQSCSISDSPSPVVATANNSSSFQSPPNFSNMKGSSSGERMVSSVTAASTTSSIWTSPVPQKTAKDLSPIPRHPWSEAKHDSVNSFLVGPNDSADSSCSSFSPFFDPFQLPFSSMPATIESQERQSRFNSGDFSNAMKGGSTVKANAYSARLTPKKSDDLKMLMEAKSSAPNSGSLFMADRYSQVLVSDLGQPKKTSSSCAVVPVAAFVPPGSSSSNYGNDVNLERIEKGLDRRTTCMIRNIPNKYTQVT